MHSLEILVTKPVTGKRQRPELKIITDFEGDFIPLKEQPTGFHAPPGTPLTIPSPVHDHDKAQARDRRSRDNNKAFRIELLRELETHDHERELASRIKQELENCRQEQIAKYGPPIDRLAWKHELPFESPLSIFLSNNPFDRGLHKRAISEWLEAVETFEGASTVESDEAIKAVEHVEDTRGYDWPAQWESANNIYETWRLTEDDNMFALGVRATEFQNFCHRIIHCPVKPTMTPKKRREIEERLIKLWSNLINSLESAQSSPFWGLCCQKFWSEWFPYLRTSVDSCIRSSSV